MASRIDQRKVIDQVFVLLGCITTVVFLVVGGLAWYAYTFSNSSVKDELTSQKIFFPAAGSAGFSADEYPTLQQYAGQQVDDGLKAKAFANDYIGHHLTKVAAGKTYSEVSALAQ